MWFTEGESPTCAGITKAWGGLSDSPLEVIAGLNLEQGTTPIQEYIYDDSPAC